MAAIAPIAAITVRHIMPRSAPIEDIIAMAGIVEIIIPSTTKADIVKTAAIIAVIIAIIGIIRITAIRRRGIANI